MLAVTTNGLGGADVLGPNTSSADQISEATEGPMTNPLVPDLGKQAPLKFRREALVGTEACGFSVQTVQPLPT